MLSIATYELVVSKNNTKMVYSLALAVAKFMKNSPAETDFKLLLFFLLMIYAYVTVSNNGIYSPQNVA